MRTLLVATTIVGLLCAACSLAWRRYERPYRVADYVRSLGGQASNINQIGPEWLNRWLHRRGYRPFAQLESVEFRDVPSVNDAVLHEVTKETGLESLILYGTEISGQGYARLRRLEGLRRFNVSGSAFDDECVAYLADLQELESHYAWATSITDVGLQHLEGLRELRALSLGRSQITGPGLASLARLTNLEYLELTETPITDDGLPYLRGFKNLKRLDLVGTATTRSGVDALQEALPDTRIFGP